MPDSVVVDASVAAKLYFIEENSADAEAALRAAGSLIAPQLILLEIASVASKHVRRGASPIEPAAAAVSSISHLLDEAVPLSDLAMSAFELASAHGFSAYDAAYLALAQKRDLRVLTADAKLIRRAVEVGLSHLVQPLTP